jgi:hypothetical protein
MAFTTDQAANLVSVHANETISVPNSHINFNNTETINVVIYASTSNGNTVNCEFSVNTSSGLVGPVGPQGPAGNAGATGMLSGPPVSFMNANSANIQYVDTYFTEPFFIPANSISANGSVYRITIAGDQVSTYQSKLNVRMGPNGNTSDQSIYNANGINSILYLEFISTVRSNTNNANVMTVCMSPYTLTDAPAGLQPTQTTTIDATVNNYIGVSYNFGYPGEGPNIFQVGVIEQIR